MGEADIKVFARLPSYNPFVGTFHHAPSAGNRGAVYFTGDIVGVDELEERKKFRHNPLTGTFHALPGYYDPLHGLKQFRIEEELSHSPVEIETGAQREFVAVNLAEESDTPIPIKRVQNGRDTRSHRDILAAREQCSAVRGRCYSDSDADGMMQFIGAKRVLEQTNAYVPIVSSAPRKKQLLIPPPCTETMTRQRSSTASARLSSSSVSCSDDLDSLGDLGAGGDNNPRDSNSNTSTESTTSSPRASSRASFLSLLNPIVTAAPSQLVDGYVSTGKGIYIKCGYHSVGEVKHPSPPKSPSRRNGNNEDDTLEYRQIAPTVPSNPFVARRLSDGEQIRVMAINRCIPRQADDVIVDPSSKSFEDGPTLPKPYFIHEKAVTEQYELVGEDQLGDGSYAVVKPAIRRENGVEVAIKQVHKRFLVSEQAKNAVKREVEIHLRLRHKNIVRLHEVYETDDFLYLVMAKARKGNLKQLLAQKRKLPEAFAAKLSQQIVRGIFFLHHSGVLHCDLKPENILLTDPKGVSNQDSHESSSPTSQLPNHSDVKACDLQVEICDFGLSVKVPDVRFFKHTGDVHKVPFSGLTGTPGYIAPELFQQQPYGKPVDMWSVGIIIYEMLTGFQPFYPPSACVNEPADFNDRIWKKFSVEAKDLVQKLLEQDPTKRFTAEQALSHRWFDTAAFAL